MPIALLLQQFVDDELSRTPAMAERLVAGALQLLRDTRQSGLSPAERAEQSALVEALQGQETAYRQAFAASLRVGVQAALEEHAQGLQAATPAPGGELELMDETRVEVDIEISRAMQLIDTTAEWELRELQTFTSTLIGQTHVSPESNPLRPLVYATALWEAACVVSPAQAHRTLLLRVSAGVAAGLLKNAWAAASTRLESQGVEPGVYRTVLLASGSTSGRGTSSADTATPNALATLLAGMPTGAGSIQVGVANAAVALGTPATPRTETSPEFDQALARLDELLRHLPHNPGEATGTQPDLLVKRLGLHRAALIASTTAPLDRQIVELVARLFDNFLTDPQLPTPYVNLLARLQGSALRVALRDPEMLNSTGHAVWHMLDDIGEAAASYPRAGDTRAASVLNICRALIEPLARAPAPDAEMYGRVQAQLDAFLSDQARAQRHAAQPAVQALQLAERREVLERQLAVRLEDQMAPMRTSAVIRRFVTSTWAKVLAESMLRDGELGDATRGYIKLVDELLWSVQLPDHPQSRQRLVSLLPSMLQRLRNGMALIDLPAAEQNHVLDALMGIHTEALRAGVRSGHEELSAAQIVQRMRDEVLPPSTGHGGFSDSVIDLGSMETVPAELMPEPPIDEPAKQIDALRIGERRRVFLKGRWACVQLLWRSDQGLFFLFAGEVEGRTHSVTRRALEKLAGAGLLLPLEKHSLVARALDRVARELVRSA